MSDIIGIDSLKLIHLYSCLIMTGVIWMVQWVHYPSFYRVDKAEFPGFAKFHSFRISFIVMPLMLIELMTAILLVLVAVNPEPWYLNIVGVALIWGSTFFLSMPCHARLASGFDAQVIKRLIATNWPRTIIWSARSILLLGQMI